MLMCNSQSQLAIDEKTNPHGEKQNKTHKYFDWLEIEILGAN